MQRVLRAGARYGSARHASAAGAAATATFADAVCCSDSAAAPQGNGHCAHLHSESLNYLGTHY
jgi:hypothetical protein